MRFFSNKMTILALLGLLILIVVIPLFVFLVLAQQQEHVPVRITSDSSPLSTNTPVSTRSWTIISRNVPAFASSGYYPASFADDDNYDTVWRSQGTPAWLAYDLSGVPSSDRDKVLVVWYNASYDYNHTIRWGKCLQSAARLHYRCQPGERRRSTARHGMGNACQCKGKSLPFPPAFDRHDGE